MRKKIKCVMLGMLFAGLTCLSAFAATTDENKPAAIAAQAEDPVKFAKKELATYLDRITDGKYSSEDGKKMFYVAVADDGKIPAGIREKLKGHGSEAFVMESSEDKLYLVGNSPRATVYAVYGFLEKYLGCRWFTYDPAEDIVPKKDMKEVKSIVKNGVNDFEEPHFAVRMLQYYTYEIGPAGTPLANEVARDQLKLIQWMAKLRLNIFQFSIDHTTNCIGLWESFLSSAAVSELRRRGIELSTGGHMPNLLFMTPADFKEHPDWRPFYKGERQGKGQFCTCNPDAREHFLKGIMDFLKANPSVTYLGLYPNDTGGWCECPLCTNTPPMDRVMSLYNNLAQRMHDETPNVRLSYIAYGSTASVLPAHEKPFPGMMVNYAPWGRDYSVPIESEKSFHDLFIKWRDYCRQYGASLILHEKYIRMEWMGFHILPLPTLSRDMKFLKKEGAAGFEQATEHCGWWVKSPNCYVLAHLMWNSDENAQALTDDFFAQYYGPYAGEVEDCYKSVESAMDFKYGGNKWKGTLEKDAEKITAAFQKALPFAGQARERFGTALERVRKLKEKCEPVYLSRLDRLEIVLDYGLQESSAWHELCQGVAAMEEGRAAITNDPAACQKQLDAAVEHFKNAAKFDQARNNYQQRTEHLGLIWNFHGERWCYHSAIIPQLHDMVAKMRNEIGSTKRK